MGNGNVRQSFFTPGASMSALIVSDDGKMKMKQIVLKYVVTFVTVIAAILAFIMTLGALAIFGMQVSSWPVLGFMAIILYHIVPRSSGTLSMSFSLIMANTYLGTMFLSRFCYQPLYYLLMIALAVSGVLVLLKGKPWWMWIISNSTIFHIKIAKTAKKQIVSNKF